MKKKCNGNGKHTHMHARHILFIIKKRRNFGFHFDGWWFPPFICILICRLRLPDWEKRSRHNEHSYGFSILIKEEKELFRWLVSSHLINGVCLSYLRYVHACVSSTLSCPKRPSDRIYIGRVVPQNACACASWRMNFERIFGRRYRRRTVSRRSESEGERWGWLLE